MPLDRLKFNAHAKNIILKFNNKLRSYINKLDQYVEGQFCYLDSNSNGIQVNKKKLAKQIFHILFSDKCKNNLVFVSVCAGLHSEESVGLGHNNNLAATLNLYNDEDSLQNTLASDRSNSVSPELNTLDTLNFPPSPPLLINP